MKRLATTFNRGAGIPIISAYQISQQAREKVRPTPEKFYTMRSLSDTSEAAKSADLIVAILRDEKLKEEKELMAGILKARDAETPPPFKLYENYSSSYIGNLEE
jgi:UDP-glucose 6-dehydrogenase